MKKIFLPFCLLLIILPTLTLAGYKNQIYNFQISYPPGWEITEQTPDFLLLAHTDSSDRFSYLTLKTDRLAECEENYTTYERSVEAYKAILTNARIYDPEFKEIANLPDEFLKFDKLAAVHFAGDPLPKQPLASFGSDIYLQRRKIYFIHQQTLYSFGLFVVGTKEDQKKNRDDFYEFFHSLKFLP